MAFTIKQAMRIAKDMNMSLASGAEGTFIRLTAEDRAKMYKQAARKAGKTLAERSEDLTLTLNLLKNMNSSLLK